MALADTFFNKNAAGFLDIGGKIFSRSEGIGQDLFSQGIAGLGEIAGDATNGIINSSTVSKMIDEMLGIAPPDEGIVPRNAIPRNFAVDMVENDPISSMIITCIETSTGENEARDPLADKRAAREAESRGESAPAPTVAPDPDIVNFAQFTVRLPMPQDLASSYRQDWTGGDTSSLGAEIYKALDDLGGDLSGVGGMDGLKSAIKKGGNDLVDRFIVKYPAIVKKLKDTATQKFLGDAAINFRNSETRQIINTKKQMLYKGHDFRSFNFTFDFTPSNELEVRKTMAIIKAFKVWSSPELRDNGEVLKFPGLFEIEFMDRTGDTLSEDFGLKIAQSALTSLDVNYTPEGIWQTFRSGFPVHITMTLGFMETQLIYRDSITNKTHY